MLQRLRGVCRTRNGQAVDVDWSTEDQQRINTFSKINTRTRGIQEKLEELKVCRCDRIWCRC